MLEHYENRHFVSTTNTIVVLKGLRTKRLNRRNFSTYTVQKEMPLYQEKYPGNSALSHGVLDSFCQCSGDCNRAHTGPCPNREGSLAAGSRWPTRLRLIGERLLCAGCLEPYDPNKRWAY